MNSYPFAEVMESDLHTVSGECWSYDQPPAFGQLVAIEDHTTRYAIVTAVTTKARDEHRKPVPLQKTYDELVQQYPHLFSMLQTTFSATCVGYYTQNTYVWNFPPHPARIHAFIRPASTAEYQAVFSCTRYLCRILQTPQLSASLEDILLAVTSHLQTQHLLSRQRLHDMIDMFSTLVHHDYRRIKLLLYQLEHM